MSRAPWIAQLYGYVVCIVAVTTFLVNIASFVNAASDRANPLYARGGGFSGGGSLTSFESFRATYQREPGPRGAVVSSDTLTLDQLRARYEALRADHIAQAVYSANQRLIGAGLLIIIAVALFVSHWVWLRRQKAPSAT